MHFHINHAYILLPKQMPAGKKMHIPYAFVCGENMRAYRWSGITVLAFVPIKKPENV